MLKVFRMHDVGGSIDARCRWHAFSMDPGRRRDDTEGEAGLVGNLVTQRRCPPPLCEACEICYARDRQRYNLRSDWSPP